MRYGNTYFYLAQFIQHLDFDGENYDLGQLISRVISQTIKITVGWIRSSNEYMPILNS